MTRNNVLASVIFELAISLKTMNFNTLIRRKNREKMISTLLLMQFLNHCIGLKRISEDQVEIITSVLTHTYAYDTGKIATLLKESDLDSDYPEQYDDLLCNMHLILSSCIKDLNKYRIGYSKSVRRNILGFHNLPRAFLSLTDKQKLSPDQAWEYSKSYFKID